VTTADKNTGHEHISGDVVERLRALAEDLQVTFDVLGVAREQDVAANLATLMRGQVDALRVIACALADDLEARQSPIAQPIELKSRRAA
jgi:hypothetical protein